MRKSGMPKYGEIVICKIIEVNPNSAFAELVEYKKRGMIHVSEVAKKWVKDIREFVKKNQYVVCAVIGIEGDHIFLSMKKVHETESERRLKEFKRENKAERSLEMIGKRLKKTLDEVYKEVGEPMLEKFGSFTKALDIAQKNPELFKEKIPSRLADEVIKLAERMKIDRTHEIKSNLKLISNEPDGIQRIKSALKEAEKQGFEVRYISAPKYQLIGKGKNLQDMEKSIEAVSKKIVSEIKKNGEADFKIEK